jgi:DNA-binding PadR family transcriptional regulator
MAITPAIHLILVALADGEKHGYHIMQRIDEVTAGASRMGPGTLYGSLKKMLTDGLVLETESRIDTALDDERRRYYRLSARGVSTLEQENARQRRLIDASRRGLAKQAKGLS